MAAYSNQEHHSYLPDQTVFFPNLTTGTSTSFPQLHQYHDQLSVENRLQTHSTSMALDDQKVSSGNLLLSKMRKDKQICSIYQAQTNKDTSNRLRKQKKTNDYQEEIKKKKNIVKQGSIEEDGEIGYVHVRARRGQATDSHSLAERVRRQKVSERMKLLQAIVPGCDKITGRALVLDEIIGYVQSLQNQVEVLSMKLASVNTMLYDSGVDLDAFMHKLDENLSTIVQPTTTMTSVQEFRPNGRASATFSPATDIYPHMPQLIDVSAPANSLPFQQYSTLPNLLSQMLME